MIKRRVFYSFHFNNDVMRVQQIRNIGALEDNKPVSINEWESVKKAGKKAIEKWIDDNMASRSCIVVLVGAETSKREWVRYEIEKAWNDGKGVVGIYIHNIKCPRSGICNRGSNPFELFNMGNKSLADIVKCHNPNPKDPYNDIKNNLERWIEEAITIRKQY